MPIAGVISISPYPTEIIIIARTDGVDIANWCASVSDMSSAKAKVSPNTSHSGRSPLNFASGSRPMARFQILPNITPYQTIPTRKKAAAPSTTFSRSILPIANCTSKIAFDAPPSALRAMGVERAAR